MNRNFLFRKNVVVPRRLIVMLVHLIAVVFSNYIAFYLRFDGHIPTAYFEIFKTGLLYLLLIRGLCFVPFRLYRGLWQYPSVHDLVNIVASTFVSTVLFFICIKTVLGLTAYPRSVFIIDAMMLICFLGGLRLIKRVYRQLSRRGDKSLLIYGGGDAGELVVRDIQNNVSSPFDPIGFIDDSRDKVGSYIRGVPVLGTRGDLGRILEEYKPEELLIAIPSAPRRQLQSILNALQHHRINIRILPGLEEILAGTVCVTQFKNISMEDLLSRKPVLAGNSGATDAQDCLAGKVVLVTGAGGSIGSELCRQIARKNPKKLILLDRYENSLHHLHLELAETAQTPHPAPLTLPSPASERGGIEAVIGDVTSGPRMEEIFSRYKPEVVFHAAAYKHVPLMEGSVLEAIENNVLGTRNMAEVSMRHEAEKFVLISTDKAVRPSSVMGMTKKIAEQYIAGINGRSRTQFMAVRFGNVLGSNGSVVPIFMEQIKRGGPVTVTHPQMKRFFMLIPEAVNLVLQAASIGRSGEVLVLEMGDQIPIVEMARNLIRFMGLIPDEDIKIAFTGLRPGERLSEELYDRETEVLDSTACGGILRVVPKKRLNSEAFGAQLEELESLLKVRNESATLSLLSRMTGRAASPVPAVSTPVAPVAPEAVSVSHPRGAPAVQDESAVSVAAEPVAVPS